MAFYPFDPETEGGETLRAGLDDLRNARYRLAHALSVLQQQSNAQIAAHFGFADATVAGNAKAELESGIGNLLANDAGVNSATVYAAVTQMLAQFG